MVVTCISSSNTQLTVKADILSPFEYSLVSSSMLAMLSKATFSILANHSLNLLHYYIILCEVYTLQKRLVYFNTSIVVSVTKQQC